MRFVSLHGSFVQAAATGDAFLESARTVGELLVRNGMKSVTVWWLPKMVLQWTVLGAAALLGVVTYGVSFSLWKDSTRHHPSTVRPTPCCIAQLTRRTLHCDMCWCFFQRRET